MMPATVGASVDPSVALHAYARARLADGDGAHDAAVANYRQALNQNPANIDIARRSYYQAIESGDLALALRSAGLLDEQGLLPRDGTLLLIGDALATKDWGRATSLADRLAQEGNFAFLAPIVRSWIATGQGRYEPAAVDPKDRFAPIARRYVDEHVALQALGRDDVATALPMIRRALSLRTTDLSGMRIAFAGQLAAKGNKGDALLLLPDEADFVRARSDISQGKGLSAAGVPLTPRQGYARLLARLAIDISLDTSAPALGVRLARIATFADPTGAEPMLVAAKLLTRQGLAQEAVVLARKVPGAGWYGGLARAELVDALAASGQEDKAIASARALTAEPGASAERFVRLGQLLSAKQDFADAAAAFRQAQTRYPAGAVPWALLLFEGSALEQSENWEEARAVLERAAKQAPDEPLVLNYLGYAQIERRQNVQGALELLKKASALKPLDASITDSLGWAQFVTGDVDAAVPVLERAAAGAPSDATINEHLGDALWAAGRRYEARYAWTAAFAVAQGDTATRLAAKAREGMKPEYAAP